MELLVQQSGLSAQAQSKGTFTLHHRKITPADKGRSTLSIVRNPMSMAFLVVLAVGCASAGGPPTPTTTESTGSQPLTCDQPVLAIHGETPARQVQGGVAVQASITVPQCQRGVRVQMQRVVGLVSLVTATTVSYDRTEQDLYRTEGGETSTLTLTITNQSSRTFRARGSLWEATIDGVVAPIRAPGLLTLTILPGRSQDVTIRGIRLTGGTYAFSLYDVPVERGEAGEVTEVGNFEWLYGLENERIEGPPAVTRRCRVRVAAADAPRQNNYFVTDRAADPNSCPA